MLVYGLTWSGVLNFIPYDLSNIISNIEYYLYLTAFVVIVTADATFHDFNFPLQSSPAMNWTESAIKWCGTSGIIQLLNLLRFIKISIQIYNSNQLLI